MDGDNPAGTLFIISTPIGNLEDITLRALRILKEVHSIACEDTRRTSLLLHHYQISKPLISYHKFNEKQRSQHLLTVLEKGQSIALVSDAGTPSLSDPGSWLIRSCRTRGIPVVSIPGASAILTALACSSFAGAPFVFLGFLPPTRDRRKKEIARWRDLPWNWVLYESPLRVSACLEDLLQLLGDRNIFFGRELTKHFEESWEATLSQALSKIAPRELKGEVTLILSGKSQAEASPEDLPEAIAQARELITSQEISKKEASRKIAQATGLPAREIYRALVADPLDIPPLDG